MPHQVDLYNGPVLRAAEVAYQQIVRMLAMLPSPPGQPQEQPRLTQAEVARITGRS